MYIMPCWCKPSKKNGSAFSFRKSAGGLFLFLNIAPLLLVILFFFVPGLFAGKSFSSAFAQAWAYGKGFILMYITVLVSQDVLSFAPGGPFWALKSNGARTESNEGSLGANNPAKLRWFKKPCVIIGSGFAVLYAACSIAYLIPTEAAEGSRSTSLLTRIADGKWFFMLMFLNLCSMYILIIKKGGQVIL
jgi:hypothetical protein